MVKESVSISGVIAGDNDVVDIDEEIELGGGSCPYEIELVKPD